MRANLLIAGIINLLVGAGWVIGGTLENNVTLAIGAFIIVTGIICIMYSRMSIQEVNGKRGTILTLSIFLYFFNFISAIILSVEYDLIKRDYAKYKQMNNIQDTVEEKQKVQVAKEIRKVDGLLKLGVAMITIAGIMIVTTSWESITDVVKLTLLIVLGLVFFGLSKFSEIKLKIRNTTIAYWLISMVSFGLAAFLIGYGQMLGDWFAINGDGEDAFIASLALIIAGQSYLTYKKFSLNSFIYTTYIALTISVLFILNQLGQEPKICVLIVAIVLLIINILPKFEKKEIKIVKNFSMIVTYILTAFVLVELKDILDDFVVLANLLIQLGSLIAIAIRQKTDISKVLSALSVIVLIAVALTHALAGLEEIYRIIITRSIFIVVTILISALIIRDSKINPVFLGIALPVIILSTEYKIDILIAVFVGVVAIGMIIFGFIKKEYKVLYIEGIVFTIINLVIQLWDLWGELPLWIYLLIGGFILIGIVTIKELRKPKIVAEEAEKQVEDSSQAVENIPATENTPVVVEEKVSTSEDENK